MKKHIILFALTVFFSSGCSSFSRPKLYETEYLTFFDTLTKVMCYSRSVSEFNKFSKLAHDEMEYYNKLFDIYKNYDGVNNLKTINDNAGVSPVAVDDAIIELLTFVKEQYAFTDGNVNAMLGSVLSIWHSYRTDGEIHSEVASLPPREALIKANDYTNIDDLVIDYESNTVFLPHKAMSLDAGALAKGFAVQKTAESLKAKGYDSFLINAGGNVRAVGTKKDTENSAWNVGISNPDMDGGGILATLRLSDMSAVTSGDYQRYYVVEGQRYSHIIDPETLYPARIFSSVTVVCEDSALADSLSTALFIISYDEGLRLINSLPNTYAIWVDKNYNIIYSDGIEAILK